MKVIHLSRSEAVTIAHHMLEKGVNESEQTVLIDLLNEIQEKFGMTWNIELKRFVKHS